MEATVTEPKSSEPSDGFHDLLQGSELGQGGADTPFAVPAIAVTPHPASHPYSEGIICVGQCVWCGRRLHEHKGEPC